MKRLALLAAACWPLALLAQAQAPEGRHHAPGAFDALEISGSAAVRLLQGSEEDVFIEGDEDAQRSVVLELRRGTLQVRPAGGWKFWSARRVQMTVTVRELRRVTISGAADLVAPQPLRAERLEIGISGAGLARFDHLQAAQLRFHVSGAGDGQFAGRVGELQLSVSGRGEFRGEHLQCERAQVSVSGIGEVQVWATQQLVVGVSGIGTVEYWGTPQLVRRSSGIARIQERGAKPAVP